MNISSERPGLRVLDGGRSLPVSQMRTVFHSAYVTNTRLMGVLAICARFRITAPGSDHNDPESWEELHQFFYIDCEEAGLEEYQQIRGDDIEGARRIEQSLTGGLGAEKIDLSEHQLRLLLQYYQRFNHSHGLPMPAGEKNYGFLLEPQLPCGPKEEYALMDLVCARVTTDEQVVNYFLMRCFGRDHDGARFLTES